jgi:hypothetical protein
LTCYGIKRPDLAAVIELAASAVDGRRAVSGELHRDCRAATRSSRSAGSEAPSNEPPPYK